MGHDRYRFILQQLITRQPLVGLRIRTIFTLSVMYHSHGWSVHSFCFVSVRKVLLCKVTLLHDNLFWTRN